MKRTSKRLLAGIAGMLFLVILGTAAGLTAGKEPRKDSGGPGTYRSQKEGKILEIDREKGEIMVQSTEDGKEILLDCSKESVMEDISLNPYNPGDRVRYSFWPYEEHQDRVKVEELINLTLFDSVEK